jgi:hypothetical protein
MQWVDGLALRSPPIVKFFRAISELFVSLFADQLASTKKVHVMRLMGIQ